MKKLVTVRHGHYNKRTGGLNKDGQFEVTSVSEQLKSAVGDGALILCSPTGRTRETASIIGATLGVEGFEEYPILNSSESEVQHDFPLTRQMVLSREEDAETIILVTHSGHADGFLECFCEKELRVFPSINYRDLSKSCFNGEARILDCESSQIIRVLP